MFQGGFCLCLVFSHPRRPCFVRRGVSPPAGGELLCPWRQSNQNATGDGSDEHFVLIVAYPTPSGPSGHLPLTGGVGPGPHYEGYPLDRAKHFRRAKSEWLVPISIGPLGPGFAKIIAGAVSLPRLALLSRCLLVRDRRAGQCPAPTKGQDASASAVGAGVLTCPLWRDSPFVGRGLPDAPF